MKKARLISVFLLTVLLAAWLMPSNALAANTSATTSISVEKELRGSTPPSKETFTFILTAEDAANPMPADSTLKITGAGSGSFGEMTFSVPNDYVYKVTESDGKAANYTYDKTVYTVTVQVTSDDNGILTARVYAANQDGNKPGKIVFSNTYTAPTTSSDSGKGTPKTGDETHNALLTAIVVCAGIGMLIVCLPEGRRKKKTDNSSDY